MVAFNYGAPVEGANLHILYAKLRSRSIVLPINIRRNFYDTRKKNRAC